MTQLDFYGRRIWVTGAGQGIGLEIARRFQAAGGEVIGLDRHFGATDYPFRTEHLDVTDAPAVADLCQRLLAEERRLDVLVNAAGILRLGTSDSLALDDWQACLDVNVSGPFYLLRQVVPLLREQGRGAIVNIASNAAHVPRLQMAGYCASKAALVSLSHCVALELAGSGVRCNVVSPGSTATPMLAGMMGTPEGYRRLVDGLPDDFKLGIPLRKVAQPTEIASTVLFLASDLASHITMQDLVVDGGATLGA